MKQIYKYPLPVQGYAEIGMILDAEVFSVAEQHGRPTLWAIVEAPPEFSRGPSEKRRFYVAFTGADLPPEVLAWIRRGTVVLGAIVVHVFEEPCHA